MATKTHTIEVDETTASALRERADERGITVSELVAEFLAADAPAACGTGQIAELERRWAAVQLGQPTLKNEAAVRWLETWGTPAFKPWSDQ